MACDACTPSHPIAARCRREGQSRKEGMPCAHGHRGQHGHMQAACGSSGSSGANKRLGRLPMRGRCFRAVDRMLDEPPKSIPIDKQSDDQIVQMKRCSLREWIPILPIPTWPLAGQCRLGQNTVVGSMTLLLAVRGNIATRSMSGPPFALQLHRTTVWCGATLRAHSEENIAFSSGARWSL